MKKVLFLALASVMMLFVACSKNEDSNGSTTTDPAKALAGTSWANVADITSGDQSEHYITTMTLKFISETSGNCHTHRWSDVWGQVSETDEDAAFTYTFDGTNGVVTRSGQSLHITMTDATHITMKETNQIFTKK